jgi:hypothetical protein
MALATSITAAGILTAKGNDVRNLRDAGETYYNFTETVETETQEWVALTEAAATAAVAAGTGHAYMGVSGTGTTYKDSLAEDDRIVGSYTYTCSAEKKTIAFV